MDIWTLTAVIALTGLAVLVLLMFLCCSLCFKKKKGTPPPQIFPDDYKSISSRELIRFPVQPPVIYVTSDDEPTLPTIAEDTEQIPVPRHRSRRRLETRISEQDLEITRRFAEGKVAELRLSMTYRDNWLEMTVREINKLHGSINKKMAYVRVKNPRERKLSIPMLQYSKQSNSLLGSHQFRFNFTQEVLETMTFRFYLWSTDQHSRQKEFGEFALEFKDILATKDLNKGFVDKYDFFIYDTQPQENDPSIRLKLKYHTKSATIIATVSEIRDLQATNWALFATGIYVKLIFKHNAGEKAGVQRDYRTKLMKGANPQFNTTFNHRVLVTELEDMTLTVEIKAKILQAEKLSVLEFSSNSTGRCREHWMQMIHDISQGKGVEMTHRISQEKRKVNPIARRMSTTAFY